MSSLSALNVDLVFQRTKGSAHPERFHGQGNMEQNAKENIATSLPNTEVTYSPAVQRIETILNVELSASLNTAFSVTASSAGAKIAHEHRESGLYRAYQVTEKSASQVARAQLAVKLNLDGTFDPERNDAAVNQEDDIQTDSTNLSIDTRAVIDNVMSVIAERFLSAREQGASDEEIDALATQAKLGVEEGLRQAHDVLEKLNEYNDRLQQHLDIISSSIDASIDETVAALIGESASGSSHQSSSEDLLNALAPQDVQSEPIAIAHSASAVPVQVQPAELPALDESDDLDEAVVSKPSERYELNEWGLHRSLKIKQSNELQLQVQTNDGDVITVVAQERFSYRDRMQAYQRQADHYQYFDRQQSQRLSMHSHLSYQVEGELDEGEIAALDQLFSQVNELADAFYSGGLGAAADVFAQFDFDTSELESMDLSMLSRQSIQMREAYRAILDAEADQPAAYWPQVSSLHQSLLSYLSDMHDRVNQLNSDQRLPNLGGHLEALLPGAIDKHPHRSSGVNTI